MCLSSPFSILPFVFLLCISARPRDHVNSRYLDKRHLYLAAVANHLVRGQAAAAAAASAASAAADAKGTKKKGARKSDREAAASSASSSSACPRLRGGVDSVRLTAPKGGDARKCSLLLRPFGAAGRSNFVVRLSVGLSPRSLGAARLLPGRSNLRRFWAVDLAVPAAARAALEAQAAAAAEAHAAGSSGGKQAKAAASRAAAAEDASLGMPATPHYNALVNEMAGALDSSLHARAALRLVMLNL